MCYHYRKPLPSNPSPLIAAELRRYLSAFQSLDIVVGGRTVRVHPPYMMQTTTLLDDPEGLAALGARHRERLRRVQDARAHAPEAVKALLRRHFGGEDCREHPVACGRAPMDAIRNLLQDAVDRHLVPAGAGTPHPDARDLRQWLKTYGIGIDCSGFVQHALTHVVRACCAAAGETSEQSRHYEVGWMLSRDVYREINAPTGADSRFGPVATPGDARPGDILVKPGHVRIVAGVEPEAGGSVVLQLAESTSAKGVPVGLTEVETDIGPRCIRIRYPEPGRPIDAQVPQRQRWQDSVFVPDARERIYILGRLKDLARFCAGHWPVMHAADEQEPCDAR